MKCCEKCKIVCDLQGRLVSRSLSKEGYMYSILMYMYSMYIKWIIKCTCILAIMK